MTCNDSWNVYAFYANSLLDLIDLHYNLSEILFYFLDINNNICTKRHIFAQFGPLNEFFIKKCNDFVFPPWMWTYSHHLTLLGP